MDGHSVILLNCFPLLTKRVHKCFGYIHILIAPHQQPDTFISLFGINEKWIKIESVFQSGMQMNFWSRELSGWWDLGLGLKISPCIQNHRIPTCSNSLSLFTVGERQSEAFSGSWKHVSSYRRIPLCCASRQRFFALSSS